MMAVVVSPFWVLLLLLFSGFLGLLYRKLYRAAKSIRIDDYTLVSVCNVFTMSRLSLVTKLAYLFGITMPQLDRGRFLLFTATVDPAAAAQAPDDDVLSHGLSHDAMLAYVARGSRMQTLPATLIIAFSGGATNKIGVPRTEFLRTLNRAGSASAVCDKLFVLDPTGMSFYTENMASFCATLRTVAAPYQRCVLLGNCMGATGALLCAPTLGLAPDSSVIAFNPVVEPSLCGAQQQLGFRIAALLKPVLCRGLRARLVAAVAESAPCRVRVHCSEWAPELRDARRLNEEEVVVGVDGEGRVAMGGGVGSGCRTRLVIHRGCTEHGMLGTHLRPSGALSIIVDDAVRYTHAVDD